MGQQTAQGTTDRRTAVRWMLRDLQAMQLMLRDGRFETGITRIGAEQEMFIVDGSWQPAAGAMRLLAELAGHPYTTEVGAFNLELNLDPQELSDDCFSRMHLQLDSMLDLGRVAAGTAGLQIVLCGTLPTLRKRDLTMANMVQNPRYLALNDALDRAARRGVRVAHQGHRRVARASGLGDGELVQRQFPGPPPGDPRRVRQRLQLRPGAQPARRSRAPRTARCCSASGCGPRPESRCSSRRRTRAGRATTCGNGRPG